VEGMARKNLAVKLEFKIPKEARSFNCAGIHRKWFELLKKQDKESEIITENSTVISNIMQFPKDQNEYNMEFPQRITKQPGQARVAEVVFEIKTTKCFNDLKMNCAEMMEFLFEQKTYFKKNVSNQKRRDSIGFLTHIHPRFVCREDLQDELIKKVKLEMRDEEVEKCENAGEDGQGYYLTINFRKQYVNTAKGLTQTETLEVQTAPELREAISGAMIMASKKKEFKGEFIPYAAVKNIGQEEFAKILQRQNKYLESIKKVEIQGITHARPEHGIICIENGNEKEDKVRESILRHPCIEGIVRTAKSEESGICMMIYKKENEEVEESYIEFVCNKLNELDIPAKDRHKTYPKVRRTNTSKWETLTRQYTKELTKTEEETKMPSKPPNYWRRPPVILNNDPNQAPELPKAQEKRARREDKENQTPIDSENLRNKEVELEKMAKQFEERIEQMERKYNELEEKITKIFDMMNNVSEKIEATNKKNEKRAERQTEMIREQLIMMRTELKKVTNTAMTEEENRKRASKAQGEKVTKRAQPFTVPRISNDMMEVSEVPPDATDES
jgi:hypothetical protein